MIRLLHRLTDYVTHRTGWVFVTALLVASYAFTQLSGSETTVVFFRFVGSLAMVSAPVLVFAQLRDGWSAGSARVARWAVFGVFCGGVLLYGPVVRQLPFTTYLLSPDSLANTQGVRGLFALYLLLEGLLWWDERRKQRAGSVHWLERLPLPWLAAGAVLLLSLLAVTSSTAVQAAAHQHSGWRLVAWYAGILLQAFVVYYAYYGLYWLHHHLLFRGVFQRRGVVFYVVGVVGVLLVFTPLHAWFALWWPATAAYRLHPAGITETVFSDLHFGLSAGVVALSLPYIVVVDWLRKEQAIARLEAEKSATELLLLKEQINPHFFFNTLNNLYAMSLTHEARTPATILQLSELMRYVIYRGKEASVSLREEVKYLQDYLDLQTIRLQKRLDLRFELMIDDDARRVPPLLFIILLENAFKHGIEPAEEDGFLHLSLTASAERIVFTCRNSFEFRFNDEYQGGGGLGLTNLRRRLEALYPGRYELQLLPGAHDYRATLTLPTTFTEPSPTQL